MLVCNLEQTLVKDVAENRNYGGGSAGTRLQIYWETLLTTIVSWF